MNICRVYGDPDYLKEMKTFNTDSDLKLKILAAELDGGLQFSPSIRLMYATDASEYRSVPIAVSWPKNKEDIKKLVSFALDNRIELIPRAAGTSLAGQVVGSGIVVDIGKYMNRILEINEKEKWVRVEPGVVLDELNKVLEEKGLFFGPETSTSNRCMIGGMVGNNACGSHSLIYGSTRDHTLSVNVVLSDGSEAVFEPVDEESFREKCKGDSLESQLYRNILENLGEKLNQEEIRREFPDKRIKRRNTGYALDALLDTKPFGGTEDFNFSKLITGSEGTLAFITEIKLNLVDLPPREKILVCAHFSDLEESIEANLIALKHEPGAIELIDKFILDCTKDNIEQKKNRFFLDGDPGAILIIEFAGESKIELEKTAAKLESDLRKNGYGYSFPVVSGNNMEKVWSLRKAGLGVIYNIPGDHRPVSVIEDTAVQPEDLMNYITDFKKILAKYGLEGIYHGHISTGELHLRPMINLKVKSGVELFRSIAEDVAVLVKKYNGSLSGEHGDGRLRGEFIPLMIGEKNYSLLKRIKNVWDPDNIFNPGKIVDTPPMDTDLRYETGAEIRKIDTYFDFSREKGIVRAVEKCNGSGDCRKAEIFEGTMCPSYMATRDEKNSTRARANILREFLTGPEKDNPFDHREIFDVMDLCLSCKGCKSECPSGVDMAKYKGEFLQHYYDSNHIPLRTRIIANISTLNRLTGFFPDFFNIVFSNILTSGLIKRILGFAPERTIPLLSKVTLKAWLKKDELNNKNVRDTGKRKLYLFADEFTDLNETDLGIKTIKLLEKLGYRVSIPKHVISGRAFISKGFIRKAGKIAKKNIYLLKDIINEDSPLLGIEPSGILTFRDEYPELVGKELRSAAEKLAKNCYMIDEFLEMEIEKGNIPREKFTEKRAFIKLHGHCHQKALVSTESTKKVLSFPENYSVEEIPSGCCGMAGSFGYEKEHYDLSMKVGELVLFPEIRKCAADTIIAAPGTSCRQQISDGTGKKAFHPVEIIYDALKA
ncbi:MAG: FAD-linked oxidase C-terminal domain-containing protein [Acidobacteriota bacterium]